jgi:hypothetical protein
MNIRPATKSFGLRTSAIGFLPSCALRLEPDYSR